MKFRFDMLRGMWYSMSISMKAKQHIDGITHNIEGRYYLKEGVRRDCHTRIRDLRAILDVIEQKLNQGHDLNSLGELQGIAVLLDCRLASLATLLSVRDDLERIN